VTEHAPGSRRAGALVPLFSIPSTRSWGIGEISDLPAFAAWAKSAGLSVLQLLPVNEMADGQSSPYSALSAMAIDPIFITMRDVPEFGAIGGEASLSADQRERLAEVRSAPSVDHRLARELKTEVLQELFEQFLEEQWRPGSPRAAEMSAYVERERWWLDDYGLFRALHVDNGARHWQAWDAPLREREPKALQDARTRLEHETLYRAWLQWIAGEQWAAARRDAGGMAILGDFPFMVSGDSADVWVRQNEFRLDASVGVPPDAFSETGQDWGLPVYRWEVHAGNGYAWLRERARRCADLFDGFRVDHLVGFYRTFVREPDQTTYFVPADEDAQGAQGERLMRLLKESHAQIIAEDLGVIPDFVRASLDRLGLPGMKVIRWEREWEFDGHPFKDPAKYPASSVAISGTHDTETLAGWWDGADAGERTAAAELPRLKAAGIDPGEPFSDRVRDALLESVFQAGSDLVLVPLQDVFGWRDRINTPAVVSDRNWSWRLPWPCDCLGAEPEASARAASILQLSRASGRSSP